MTEPENNEERWETLTKLGDPDGSVGARVTARLGRPDRNGQRSPMHSVGLFRRGKLLCWIFPNELVQYQGALHEAEVIIDTERMNSAKERNSR